MPSTTARASGRSCSSWSAANLRRRGRTRPSTRLSAVSRTFRAPWSCWSTTSTSFTRSTFSGRSGDSWRIRRRTCTSCWQARRDPGLPLHRLRLAGRLTELRAKDLAFSLGRSGSVLRHGGARSATGACRYVYYDRTEGWAAALRFAAIALRTEREAESFVPALARTEQAVGEYLVAEVLGAQPPRVRAFLLRTSICDRLDGALADDLTGRTDGARTRAALERDNVFLELEPDGRWYRYHTLFAGLLRAEAQRTRATELDELHRRAARRLARDGDRLAALRHALAAGDAERQARSCPSSGSRSTAARTTDWRPQSSIESTRAPSVHIPTSACLPPGSDYATAIWRRRTRGSSSPRPGADSRPGGSRRIRLRPLRRRAPPQPPLRRPGQP